MLGDGICAAVALLAAYNYRFHLDRIPIPGTEPPAFDRYIVAIPVVMLVMVVCLAVNRAYNRTRGRAFIDEVYGLIGGVATSAVILLAAMSLYRGFSYSRLVVVYAAAAGIVVLVLWRGLSRLSLSALRRRGLGTTRALVVGSGTGADALIHRLEMFPEYGYELIGVVDDRLEKGSEYLRLPVVGDSQDLNHLIMRHDVEEVFVALAEPDYHKILRMVAACSDT